MVGMLPRSRLAPIFLVGLGALLLSIGLVLPMWFPDDDRLPASIDGWTVRLVDDHARVGFDTVGVTEQVHVSFQPSGDDDVLARVGRSVVRQGQGPELERLVDAEVVSFRMNRVSGAAMGPATWSTMLATPPRQEGMGGVWLKFPAQTTAQEYGVFDDVTREAVLAKPAGSSVVDGRTVYHFMQTVPDTVVVEPEMQEPASGLGPRPEVALNPAGDPVKEATDQGLPVEHYQATKIFDVDAQTGIIVNQQVRSHRWTEFSDGTRQTVLAFDGQYPAEDTAKMWELVHMFPDVSERMWASRVLMGVGALAVVVGFVTTVTGVRRPTRR